MSLPRSSVPDLLKRFVPTSFKLIARGCVIETNDVDILEEFDDPSATIPAGFHIRIVRDDETVNLRSDVRLACTLKACLLLSEGTIVMVDRERQSVFGFVSPNTAAKEFVQHLLPLALDHAHLSTAATAGVHASIGSPGEDPTVSNGQEGVTRQANKPVQKISGRHADE